MLQRLDGPRDGGRGWFRTSPAPLPMASVTPATRFSSVSCVDEYGLEGLLCAAACIDQ